MSPHHPDVIAQTHLIVGQASLPVDALHTHVHFHWPVAWQQEQLVTCSCVPGNKTPGFPKSSLCCAGTNLCLRGLWGGCGVDVRRRIALVNWRTAKEAAKAAFRAQALALGDTGTAAGGSALVRRRVDSVKHGHDT